MNKNYLFLTIAIVINMQSMAQEIVSTIPENKNAVIEEYTGLNCTYCPVAHAIAYYLLDTYPEDVFVVKIHEGGYATPGPGQPDFTTPFGSALANQAQIGGSYPSASTNRHVFPSYSANGGTGIPGGYNATTSNPIVFSVEETLAESAYLNVGANAVIDYATNTLTVNSEVYYTASSSLSTNRLNIALLQNNTIAYQSGTGNFPGGNDYVHQNRLVHFVSGQWGEVVNNTSQGDLNQFTHTYQIPSDYNGVPVVLEDLEVIVYVAENTQEIINGSRANITYERLDNDLGVISLESPNGLQPSAEEIVSVTLENFGLNSAENFQIAYQVNGADPVVETFSGSIPSTESYVYEFNTLLDLSGFAIGSNVNISVTAYLENDENSENDSISENITLELWCQPAMDCSFGDGMTDFAFGDISNPSGCEGYGDFTYISTELVAGETYDMYFETGYGSQLFKVWIDFNDDYNFTTDEIILETPSLANGQGSGTYSGTLPVTISANAPYGPHMMRVKSNYAAAVPDDACEVTQYGETEDYTVNIVESLSIEEIDGSLIKVFPNPSDGIYNINLNGEILTFEISNILGQFIKNGKLENGNNMLDLTNQKIGTYFLKLISNSGKTKTIKLIKH